MYGASGKLGRGGGGAGRRNIHAPPIKRPASTGRLSIGGGARGRGGVSSAAVSSPSLEAGESFNLVRENPLNFGMAIKLAPNLVEEIKRVEAEGGTARIKFDANANNPNGNVIQVGDKTFRFTWSSEPGHFCDIYEERRSGEDGNGLLVESGATWRKLNVERELDESTKNHVKRRSEEAERKLKSRRAIVLDHQTPSMKNQLKDLAAAESNPRRNFKHKKEPPFRKPKSELPSAGRPPKSVDKFGLPATRISKVKLSSGSPLPCQLEQHGGFVPPGVSGNFVKQQTGPQNAAVHNKDKAASSDKEMCSRLPNSSISEKFKHNQNTEANLTDLRSLIISILHKHQHKGMNLKALEKAIGDSMPNSARQIEPILKQVATFQAPGKYFLKPGVEMESFKKPPPHIASPPEISRHESPAPQKVDQLPAQDPSYFKRTTAKDEKPGELNSTPVHSLGTEEKIHGLGDSPERLGDNRIFENSRGLAGSSSDSESDSDSDSDSSSNSSSDSEGNSKSKSPMRSRSRSSNDSESDATSCGKQASDEDVDITTSDDDEESRHKLQDSGPVSLKSPLMWNDPDNEYVDIGNNEDVHVSDVVDIEKDSPEDAYGVERPERNYSVPNEGAEPVEEINPSSFGHHRQDHDRKAYDGPDGVVNYGFKPAKSGTVERSSKGKSKQLDDKHSDEQAYNRKKLKSQNLSQPVSGIISLHFSESPSNSSLDRSFAAHASIEVLPGGRNPDKPEILDRCLGGVFQRGNSDLELGELQEPFSDRTPGPNEQLDDKSSFRHLENKQKGSEHRNSKFGRGNTPHNNGADTGKLSSPNLEKTAFEIRNGKAPEHNADGLAKPDQKSSRSLHQHNQSQGNHITDASQLINGPEINRSRFAEAGTGQGPSSDSYGDTSKKVPVMQQDSDPVQGVGPHTKKENKKRKPKKSRDSNDRRIDASLTGRNGVGQKQKDSSLDVDTSPYTRYEKEEPELKGPINNVSQYREYVKEYQEKYESYSSLDKILQSYRDEFSKLGKDLEAFNGRDMKRYNEILAQMRSSFCQCGERHKRLKKIYVVLYEELKQMKQMIKDYATSYKKD